jgi:hypothetical protein
MVMAKPSGTRTAHRLPFGELDPHRFEDLVRELLLRFRTFRSVEAIGRSGADLGVDIRAYEVVPGESDRLWHGQVKRKVAMGPADVRAVVEEAIPESPEGGTQPYAFLLAAPVDFSRASQDAAREMLASRGVREAHLWGRGELEDLLYLPANEVLLHKYFDIPNAKTRQRRDAYRRWLQFTENWATWAFEPEASLPKFIRELHDAKSALDLVASDSVNAAIQNYIDHLAIGMAAVEEATRGTATSEEQLMASGAAFGRAMQPYRDKMLSAMREDVGIF